MPPFSETRRGLDAGRGTESYLFSSVLSDSPMPPVGRRRGPPYALPPIAWLAALLLGIASSGGLMGCGDSDAAAGANQDGSDNGGSASDGGSGMSGSGLMTDACDSAGETFDDVRFPDDSGVLDVTQAPYNADPTGANDSTAAIQMALDQFPNGNRIIYLPNGEYQVTDTLRWPAGRPGATDFKRTILQGQSRSGVVIRVPDGHPNFSDAANPRAVIFTGTRPAQRFRNAIRNLTINTGSNNPGAIGARFIANNQGAMMRVSIVSEDRAGRIGLDMGYTDEIGPLLIQDVSVRGYDVGIFTQFQTASVTLEHIELSDQNVFGFHNVGQSPMVRGLISNNSVTAIYNEKDTPGTFVLIDAELRGTGDASMVPAIWNQRSLYVRDLSAPGYQKAIDHDNKGRGNIEGADGPDVAEWIDNSEPQRTLFESPEESLRLTIREVPTVPWDDPETWANPASFGGVADDDMDDTEAIQAAIDSGATTVYLPNGTWTVEGTVELRGDVYRLIGTEARVAGGGTIELKDGTHPVVVMERFTDTAAGGLKFVHGSSRAWAIKNVTGGKYSNTGTGDLYLNDVVGGPYVFKDQNVWARQLNQETDTQETDDAAKVVNDGGRLWVLGMKTERAGTIIDTRGGGYTELVGAFLFSTGAPKNDPAFVNTESSVSLAGVTERCFNSCIETWIKETRSGEERTQMSSFGFLYRGYESAPDPLPECSADR